VFPLQILGTALFIAVIVALNASKERVVVQPRPEVLLHARAPAFNQPAG
jgi:hypothetical protein